MRLSRGRGSPRRGQLGGTGTERTDHLGMLRAGGNMMPVVLSDLCDLEIFGFERERRGRERGKREISW